MHCRIDRQKRSMTISSDTAERERASGAAPPKPPPGRVARAYFGIARGFWTGGTRRRAWLLTVGVLGFPDETG